MSNIICHIVGIKEKNKKKFVEEFSKLFTIIDLDEINQNIFQSEKLNILYKKYNTYKNSKNNLYKTVDKEMFEHWKSETMKHIKGDKIVLIGYNYFRTLTKNIKIDTNNKFIIKYDKYLIRDMIKRNLDNNYNNIIKGRYHLDNINYDILSNNEKKIIDYYKGRGYFEKNFNEIIHILNQINNNDYKDEGIWFASANNYTKKVNNKKEKIFGFTDPMKALLHSFDIDTSSDTVKINDEDILKHKRYLYYLSFNTFIPNDNKYVSNVPAIIIKKDEIKNVYLELKRGNII